MSRTTVDIDSPVLEEIRQLGEQERKSMGRVISDLLAEALAARRREDGRDRPRLTWVARPMAARVDLDDKDALHRVLDQDNGE